MVVEKEDKKNPFAESRGRTRMAGTRVIDLFTTQQDYMATPYARGSNMPDRFKETRDLIFLINSQTL